MAGGQRKPNWFLDSKSEVVVALREQGKNLAKRLVEEVGEPTSFVSSSGSDLGWVDWSGMGVPPCFRLPVGGRGGGHIHAWPLELEVIASALVADDLDWPRTVGHYLLSPELEREVESWRSNCREVQLTRGLRETPYSCTCTNDGGHDEDCGVNNDTPCAVCSAPQRYHPHDPTGNGVAVCFAHMTKTVENIDESDVRYAPGYPETRRGVP